MPYKEHETSTFSGIMFACIVCPCANAINDEPKMNSLFINELKVNGKLFIRVYLHYETLA
jgi:triacylglycerol esterase/lipase EstA (alpha/beta hydrolase family)